MVYEVISHQVKIYKLVGDHMDWPYHKVKEWYRKRHSSLGASPEDLVEVGRGDRVIAWLEEIIKAEAPLRRPRTMPPR